MGDFPLILILVGGLGSRLKSVVSDRPKALAEAEGVPFLDIQLSWLVKQGARDVVLLTGFKAQNIDSYIVGGSSWDLNLSSLSESSPLGTGGAILNAVSELNLSKGFLVLNGDSLTEVSLKEFSFNGKDSDSARFVVVHQKNSQRFGTVKFDSDNILVGFQEKSKNPKDGWINAGIYYFPPRWFKRTKINSYPVSLENDLIPQWLSLGRSMGVFPTRGNFIDIGTPESFSLFQQQGKIWQ
jgi:NDP-sugar pyrophosphorylase family protein